MASFLFCFRNHDAPGGGVDWEARQRRCQVACLLSLSFNLSSFPPPTPTSSESVPKYWFCLLVGQALLWGNTYS